jgi:hypothetical protein
MRYNGVVRGTKRDRGDRLCSTTKRNRGLPFQRIIATCRVPAACPPPSGGHVGAVPARLPRRAVTERARAARERAASAAAAGRRAVLRCCPPPRGQLGAAAPRRCCVRPARAAQRTSQGAAQRPAERRRRSHTRCARSYTHTNDDSAGADTRPRRARAAQRIASQLSPWGDARPAALGVPCMGVSSQRRRAAERRRAASHRRVSLGAAAGLPRRCRSCQPRWLRRAACTRR